MKRIAIILCLVSFVCFNAFSQNDIYEDISSAFTNSDQKLISKYLGSKVELTLNDQSNVYSKTQAEMVLKDFFNKYTVSSFQLLYKNNPNGEASRFAIGSLITESGNFRVYFILKQADGGVILQEMRFEQERSR